MQKSPGLVSLCLCVELQKRAALECLCIDVGILFSAVALVLTCVFVHIHMSTCGGLPHSPSQTQSSPS